ncbi:S8 family serine peptidase [Tautonia sociabilis]|uniref:Protease n=1 Tax=Tautonia sociabilis TaxID=2080755 RepID=A0A432MII7_9BACT|nr:S8 family serine peptidase [Tautonia sociabilis]RUL87173.1 protease [Tautonia sociabilis]
MAARRRDSSKKSNAPRSDALGPISAPETSEADPVGPGPYTTGRFVVVHRDPTSEEGLNRIADAVGLSDVANSADFEDGAVDFGDVEGADGIHFRELGVSVYQGDPGRLRALSSVAGGDSPVELVVPERFLFIEADLPLLPDVGGPVSIDYLRGYRDSLSALIDLLSRREAPDLPLPPEAEEPAEAAEPQAASYRDTDHATWGLQAIRVLRPDGTPLTRFSGNGVRVAILDTGIDPTHPDFSGRRINSRSFVAGEPTVQDVRGHGTHVAGTACGPRPYGVAPGAELFVGKVFPANGGAPDANILAGINWAIASRCQVANLSLGLQVGAAPPDPLYEEVGRRSMDAGTLLVAAAGNDSNRPSIILPVARPANSTTILAVGAVDARLNIGSFSNRGLGPRGGEVDLVAPGLDIFSSYPDPVRFRRLPGTSMAAPHVVGVAALYSELNNGVGGRPLWDLLLGTTRRLRLGRLDAGDGLVQAPLS